MEAELHHIAENAAADSPVGAMYGAIAISTRVLKDASRQ
jgi:hypothetical protein